MQYQLSYKRFGEHAILIEWPARIDENILNDVLSFKRKIEDHYVSLKVQINHAYNSILVSYEYVKFEFKKELKALSQIYASHVSASKATCTLWKIPVCYDETFGIDLQVVSQVKGISKEELVERHTKVLYTIYFIGFLPGFLYLGGLDASINVPRRATPRLQIEKGAVAIGGKQTGIYPVESPGGWHIIGNTPINFFDASKEPPCFASAGDKIEFVPISLKQYHDIKTLADARVYQLESEVLND